MIRAIYIVGGAGTGKSTFMAALLADVTLGPLEDLFQLRNAKSLVTLRGHRMSNGGMYLGRMRESFPGTDGLDRASSPVGVAWLAAGDLPPLIVGEGATLSTAPFLTALATYTDLLLVHLVCPAEVKEKRFAERGSTQDSTFVKLTATRSANLAAKIPARVLLVDTSDPDAWEIGLDCSKNWG